MSAVDMLSQPARAGDNVSTVTTPIKICDIGTRRARGQHKIPKVPKFKNESEKGGVTCKTKPPDE